MRQELAEWELRVVDDGSPDDVAGALAPFRGDPRVALDRLPANGGLGAALNHGLDRTAAPVVAYLPADDLLDPGHLRALLGALDAAPDAVLAWSGRRGGLDEPGLQLVQLAHRRTPDRWRGREELESDDLERLLLGALRRRGAVVATGAVTCTWTQHPGQRHRALRESLDGGLNVFRARYGVRTPLRLAPSDGAPVDEVARYARYRHVSLPEPDGLTILLAGELAYNPERVLALAERGHRLLGFWTPDGLGFNTVGPLPFPGVRDVGPETWRRARPDVIYGLLNWRAVPFVHGLLDAGVPLVWHYKEAPQRSLLRGEWARLADLHARSAARLYASPEEAAYMEAALPGRADPATTHVLDGDLPRADRLGAERTPPLSDADGAPHTVVVGRPHGLDGDVLADLAARGVHVHLHAFAHPGWVRQAAARNPGHVHLEAPVEPDDWTWVLSRYDAGWLHPWRSENHGDVARAAWEDLNLPARLPTLLAAGVPLLVRACPGHVVASEALVARTGAGLRYADPEHLAALLRDAGAVARARAAAWRIRGAHTFDAHADRLIGVLRAAALRD